MTSVKRPEELDELVRAAQVARGSPQGGRLAHEPAAPPTLTLPPAVTVTEAPRVEQPAVFTLGTGESFTTAQVEAAFFALTSAGVIAEQPEPRPPPIIPPATPLSREDWVRSMRAASKDRPILTFSTPAPQVVWPKPHPDVERPLGRVLLVATMRPQLARRAKAELEGEVRVVGNEDAAFRELENPDVGLVVADVAFVGEAMLAGLRAKRPGLPILLVGEAPGATLLAGFDATATGETLSQAVARLLRGGTD